MRELQAGLGLTYLFISHDPCSDFTHGRPGGRHVIWGGLWKLPTQERFSQRPVTLIPGCSWTRSRAWNAGVRGTRPSQGDVANPIDRPSGCHFHPRCPFANDRCRTEDPSLKADGKGLVSCHGVEEGRLPAWEGMIVPTKHIPASPMRYPDMAHLSRRRIERNRAFNCV